MLSLSTVMSDLRRVGFMDAKDLADEIRSNKNGNIYAASAVGNLKEAFELLSRDPAREALAQLDKTYGEV